VSGQQWEFLYGPEFGERLIVTAETCGKAEREFKRRAPQHAKRYTVSGYTPKPEPTDASPTTASTTVDIAAERRASLERQVSPSPTTAPEYE
jgi:hypothetical protein